MKYIKIILKNYKRLALNNITHLEYTPDKKLQVLLGTNGCGKSSLIRELSFIPSVSNDFNLPGLKHVEGYYNNNHYILTCTMDETGNKYEFKKNGEELNPGRTITTCKELIKRELGVTLEIHELLIGELSFTQMSTNDRRYWISKLSTSDFTYANSYYKRLTTLLRDKQGGLKLNQTRLVQETNKLLTTELSEKIKEEINSHKKLLNYLLSIKKPIENDKKTLALEAKEQLLTINKLNSDIIKNSKDFLNREGFTSIEAMNNSLVEVKNKLYLLNNKKEKLCEQINENESAGRFADIKNDDLDIDVNISNLKDEILKIKGRIIHNIEFNNYFKASNDFNSIYENLTEVVVSLQPTFNTEFSKDKLIIKYSQRKECISEIDALEDKVLKLKTIDKKLEFQKNHDKIECPNCNHGWIVNYSVKKHEDLKKEINDLDSVLNDKKLLLKQINEFCELADAHISSIRVYMNICKSWVSLKPVWDFISNESIITHRPKEFLQILGVIKNDLELSSSCEILEDKLNELIKLKNFLLDQKETNINNLISKLNYDRNELENVSEEIKKLQKLEIKFNNYIISYKKTDEYVNNLSSILNRRSKITDEYIDILKTETLNSIINLINLELSKKESLLLKEDNQKAVIEDIEKQITTLKSETEVLKIAVKSLSPSEGLIAKNVVGFINHLIQQMNSFIKKIWAYPLTIDNIIINDDLELDYKFSFKVNNGVNYISDISKGSSSIKEIIDFAFKVVAMQYLGLKDFPLYLDEFGSKFDSKHRSAATHTVNELINLNNFSQVYMISHHLNSFGSILHCDINVLDGNNISLPSNTTFNSNLILI